MFSKLFLCFLLTSLVECLESEDLRKRESAYMLIHPKAFVVGRNESLCLSLHDVNLPTKIVMDLKIDDYHEIITDILQIEHTCFKLFIKPEKVKYSQYGSLHLQIQLNGTIYSSFNTDPIFIIANDKLTFIETDKTTYKPGDVVKFRILILDNYMKPIRNYNISSAKIINPSGNVVSIWENLPMTFGLLQLEHQLNEDTLLGKWKIEVNNNKLKSFIVKRYVLPRYKVTLNYPKLIHTSWKNVEIVLCAKYPYGKAVKGSALIKISNPGLLYEPLTKYQPITDGCVKFVLTENDITLKTNFKLNILGIVTELETSHVEVDTGKVEITSKPYDFTISNENVYFQPGLPYYGKLNIFNRLIDIENSETIEICYHLAVKNKWNLKRKIHCTNFTIDSSTNSIDFSLYPFKASVVQIHLKARCVNSKINMDENLETFIVNRWYSPSGSFIFLNQTKTVNKCKSTQHLTVYYTSDRIKKNDWVTFYYLIQSKEEIVRFGKISHNSRKQQQNLSELKHLIGEKDRFTKLTTEIDKFSFKFKLDSRITSNVKFLIYYVTKDGEVVSSSSSINIEKCLSHTVKASWSNTDIAPGDLATMNIEASPNSICTISSTDRAVYFMDNWRLLNVQTLLSPYEHEKVPKANFKLCQPHSKRKAAVENLEELKIVDTYLDLRRRRRSYATGNTEEYDSSDVFDSFGTSVISNLKLLTKVCQKEQRFNRPEDRLISAGAELLTNPYKTVDYDDNSYDSTTTTLRSYFPETWLWELVTVGKDGNAQIDRYTPHTITNWTTNVLCVSENDGPGLDVPNDLRTFQPFFLDVLLPYSVKRDEIFHLETILFNYLNYSLPVQLNLIQANGFKILDNNEKESGVTYCISANSSVMHTFRIKPLQLGVMNLTIIAEIDTSYPGECGPEYIINRRDVLYKSVRVEAEGYPSEIVKSTILCTADSYVTSNMSWNITFPDGIVRDSLKAKIILNADLMGPTLHNLDKIINMPTGCGEQVMATMAPNLFVLKYLTATKQINSKLYGRIVKNLKIGYQRILDYVHDDGSFSAFGYHDRNGSMFLTAFVIRTLNVAKSYIYVDKHVITRATQWIIDNQLENGCFPAVSHVFQYMGGTSLENSTASLTAYVMLSLLESNINIPEKVTTNVKYCIRANHQPDKYTLAISTYALYLLDWQSEADRNLQKLLDLATKEGELLWWSDSNGSPSLNIEMTSYVLMSLLYENVTHNLVHANSVVKWLSTQRRSFGSFVSTQDTAVALDAISRYAAKIKNKNSNLNVAITADADNYKVQIKSSNKLKNKEIDLHGYPTNINVHVNGKGCLLAQVLYSFNLNEMANSEAFKLIVDMDPVSTIDKCSIAIVTPCISYVGRDLRSNMAVLEVTMPSGYEADTETLYKLLDQSNVTKLKRFEEIDNKVILYFVELSNEPICVPFTIKEHAVVENHVAAIVNLYDYYKPEYKVSTTYKINTCRPNDIQSTSHTMPEDVNFTLNDTNERVNKAVLRTRRNIDYRTKINNGLNEDFVDMDIELAVPEGDESNMPVYVMPDKIDKSNTTAIKLNAL